MQLQAPVTSRGTPHSTWHTASTGPSFQLVAGRPRQLPVPLSAACCLLCRCVVYMCMLLPNKYKQAATARSPAGPGRQNTETTHNKQYGAPLWSLALNQLTSREQAPGGLWVLDSGLGGK
jgi:hypothetical protein